MTRFGSGGGECSRDIGSIYSDWKVHSHVKALCSCPTYSVPLYSQISTSTDTAPTESAL